MDIMVMNETGYSSIRLNHQTLFQRSEVEIVLCCLMMISLAFNSQADRSENATATADEYRCVDIYTYRLCTFHYHYQQLMLGHRHHSFSKLITVREERIE